MLDIKKLIAKDKEYLWWIEKKWWDLNIVEKVVKKYEESVKLSQELDEKRARQNSLAKKISTLSNEEKPSTLSEMKEIKVFLKSNIDKEKELKEEYKKLLSSLPNPAHISVIKWETEEDNKVIRFSWEKQKFDFEPKPHWELWEDLDLIDSKRWAKVAWARFHFLKNELVLLQFALIQYAFEVTMKHWFSPILPPYLVNKEVAFWTWYLEAGHEDEVYCVNKWLDDLYLIWTSEVPNTAFFQNEIIDEKDLPIKFVAYSPCFRREAWSWWKDSRWILRCHQFEKMEMAVFADPKKSWEEHEKIREAEEAIYQGLWLHYQLIDICSADLGWPAAKKYDLEAWMPGQDAYREITSTSNCTDFQARRLSIRIKREDWTKEILHTLNWTAVAVWRTLIAIMEQYQTKNWEIEIPKALRKWTGFDKISKK